MKFSLLIFSLSLILNLTLCAESSVYGVVLAGGSGKRLWPLSRKDCPKQFVPFINDTTLLEETLNRNKDLTSSKKLWVITTEQYKEQVRHSKINLIDQIIIEPISKNTAPALLLTIFKVYQKDPEAIVFFVPSDHFIPNKELYSHSLSKAIAYAEKSNDIVLIGIQPRNPASDYGYIEYKDLKDDNDIYSVVCFHEKPNYDKAKIYLEAGNYLWNAGIFCAKAKVFINQFNEYCPKMFESIKNYLENENIDIYASLEDIPFDKAVLEKTKNCAVIPSYFQWSDVGTLEQFLLASSIHQKGPSQIEIHAKNNLCAGTNKLLVVLGLDNLCVVETNDVLFITSRTESERIRDVLKQLESRGYAKYL